LSYLRSLNCSFTKCFIPFNYVNLLLPNLNDVMLIKFSIPYIVLRTD
jgi:hypothetical protein